MQSRNGVHCLFSQLALASFLLTTLPVLTVPLQAAQDKISSRIDNNQTVLIHGSIHPRATRDNDRGAVASSLVISDITLNLKLSGAQQADLDQLLENQRDPSSSDYQKWLSPEEFGGRFGASAGDISKITEWLQSQGFAVSHVSRSQNWIAFNGTAAQVDATFHTALHTFLVDGETHFAPTQDPSIPAAFADAIASFRGLSDFRLRPQRSGARTPNYTTSSGSHYLAPADIGTIYDLSPLYSAGINGTGQKIVIAGQSDVNVSDLQTFRSTFGLSATVPQMVLYGSDPGTVSGDMEESDLDLEWSGAVAPNASIIFVYSKNVINSVQYAISQNLAPVISLSYGGCEAENSSTLRSVAQQANAQGITWMASSGDSGAAGCDSGKTATHGLSVNYPASIPEVTAVGGTEFNEGSGNYWNAGTTGGSALSYIPEMAWNDSTLAGQLSATGGGASVFYTKPSWQTGSGVPADSARDVPDVSLTASADHDGYLIVSGGKLEVVGGTSVSSPSFAAIVSLLNQFLVTKGVQATPGLGNINPTLYHLAASANTVFHDITVGNNIVPCTVGSPNCVNGSLGYSAGPGYDQVTGLGSVDANNLINQWTTVPASISTTLTLSANPASIAKTASTTLTATVKPASGATVPTGSVTFLDGTVTLGTVSTTASGTSAVASLVVSGSALTSGSNTITAAYAGSATFNGSTNTTGVTVTGGTTTVSTTSSISANPSSITTLGSTVLTITVKPASGTVAPTGTAVFSLGSVTLGSAALVASGTSATASYSVSAAKLAMGNNTVTATYGGAAGFTESSASTNVAVTAPVTLVGTTTTVTATSSTIASTASTILTTTVKAASGIVSPTGSVVFTVGTTTLGTIALTASASGSATASITVQGSQLAIGLDTIKAAYAGTVLFGASNNTVSVTVTGNTANSAVAASITPTPVVKQGNGWFFTIKLANTGGATTFSTFTVNGTSYAAQIPQFFGSSSLPANAQLTSSLEMTNVPVPTSIIFGFGGTDANGHTWNQTVTVPFQ